MLTEVQLPLAFVEQRRDCYDRPIFEDEYGEYALPTPESLALYRNTRERISRLLRRINKEVEQLREIELPRLNERIAQSVIQAERKAGGPLGDGRDYRRIAPKYREQQEQAERRLSQLFKRHSRVVGIGGNFNLHFQAEIAIIDIQRRSK